MNLQNTLLLIILSAATCGRSEPEPDPPSPPPATTTTSAPAEPPAPPPPSPPTARSDLFAGLAVVNDLSNRPASPVPFPRVGVAFSDPEFSGATLRRISDMSDIGGARDSAGIVPMYSGTPPWNADESLLLLYAQRYGHQLYEGRPPYRHIRALNLSGENAPKEPETLIWSTTDPDVLYFPTLRKRLRMLNVRTGEATDLHDFTDVCGATPQLPLLMETHHWTSADNRYWGFKCRRTLEDRGTLFVYDRIADRVIWTRPYTGASTQGIWGTPMPSPSGRWFITRQDRIEVRDRSGEVVRLLGPNVNIVSEHMTMGQAVDPETKELIDVYCTLYNDGPHGNNAVLVCFRLDTGESTGYVSEMEGYPYPPSGIHHSMISYRQPNYVWTSIIGGQDANNPAQTDGQTLLGNEILITDLTKRNVARVAHHRSRRGLNPNYEFSDYWQEPHVAASPDGCRAIFGSDWSAGPGQTRQRHVYTFVVELPCYQP